MNKFLIGATAVSLAFALTACDDEDPIGGGGDDNECIFDTECSDGFSCDLSDAAEDESGVCFDTCVENAQCAEGFECSDAGTCDSVGGETATYNKVLIVSRTDDDKDNGDCRAPNPGPDIDYVRAERAGTIIEPDTVSGAHGGYCGDAQDMGDGPDDAPWAEPGVVLENLSIGINDAGETEAGVCSLEQSATKYFFMGTGQEHSEGETIAEGTGYLLVTLAEALQDGDIIEIGEVGKEPGDSGADQTCGNIDTPRPGDKYGVYIVHSDVTSVQAGDALTAPEFIHVKDDLIGLTKSLVILD